MAHADPELGTTAPASRDTAGAAHAAAPPAFLPPSFDEKREVDAVSIKSEDVGHEGVRTVEATHRVFGYVLCLWIFFGLDWGLTFSFTLTLTIARSFPASLSTFSPTRSLAHTLPPVAQQILALGTLHLPGPRSVHLLARRHDDVLVPQLGGQRFREA